jgi:endonuclease/exonuclease/phosphatase family metal-dependent hydrolase
MSEKRSLTVVTYNIHKGLSQFNKRLVLHDIRERLKSLDADVAFLQEVQGKHEIERAPPRDLARDRPARVPAGGGCHSVYGMNAVYQDGTTATPW